MNVGGHLRPARWRRRLPVAWQQLTASEGTPPDISKMSPKERYDRLYDRVMRAAETGDQATVAQFTPMTVMAYQQLDSIDADARFHMAMLLLHTGQVPGAVAEADSLLKFSPGHLFGYMIRGAAARWNKDQAALKKARSDFLVRYDTEMQAKRPEYGEHERAVKDFRAAALGQAPSRPRRGVLTASDAAFWYIRRHQAGRQGSAQEESR